MEFKTYKELKENYPNVEWIKSYNESTIKGKDKITGEEFMLNGSDLVKDIYKPIKI